MSTSLRFRDHEDFHRAALHMGVAGGMAGLAAHVASLVDPTLGSLAAPIPLAAVAGAAAYGAAEPRTRTRLRDLAIVSAGAVSAALALRILAAAGPEPSLGAMAFAVIFGLLLARGARGHRFAAILAGAAGAALLGRFVLQSFVGHGLSLPGWLLASVSGAAFGLVALVGRLPRHLELHTERVDDAWNQVKDKVHGEMGELLGRAATLWEKVEQTVEPNTSARHAIEDSVLRLFEVARKWLAVESESQAQSADRLLERMQEIDQKIERTEDPIARSQYESARAALAEQLRYVKEISTSRERVIARMHHYLAAMERLRFAVINNRSADASRLSTEVQPILEDLAALGKEIDCTSEAIGEMETETAREIPPN